ncbi:hypothetical protein R1sor_023373 [Riccia sorocarpa]|uniref:Uncharacterized protein n=1 Tax=Riccia sorocarpa TaxID=122646 RepID=A0ABD3GMH3_9MARC
MIVPVAELKELVQILEGLAIANTGFDGEGYAVFHKESLTGLTTEVCMSGKKVYYNKNSIANKLLALLRCSPRPAILLIHLLSLFSTGVGAMHDAEIVKFDVSTGLNVSKCAIRNAADVHITPTCRSFDKHISLSNAMI